MPKAALRKYGPQKVPKYAYPQGVVDGTWEVVSRQGRLTAPGEHDRPGEREFEPIDGKLFLRSHFFQIRSVFGVARLVAGERISRDTFHDSC